MGFYTADYGNIELVIEEEMIEEAIMQQLEKWGHGGWVFANKKYPTVMNERGVVTTDLKFSPDDKTNWGEITIRVILKITLKENKKPYIEIRMLDQDFEKLSIPIYDKYIAYLEKKEKDEERYKNWKSSGDPMEETN